MNCIYLLKRKIRIILRNFNDFFSGKASKFAKKDIENICLPYSFSVSQEIKKSETFDNKVFNIQKVSQKINEYIIQPNEIFSFWKSVGKPDKILKESRSIVKGKTKNKIGGGICQVSGIIYLLGLSNGLEIIERHNHSIDLYTEETRFAPLGTDATVAFGFKDLQIKNNYDFPIKFHLEIIENQLIAKLLSICPIKNKTLSFQEQTTNDGKIIKVFDNEGQILNESFYKNLNKQTNS